MGACIRGRGLLAALTVLLFMVVGFVVFSPSVEAKSGVEHNANSNCDSLYVVKRGDTLTKIARRCSTTVAALVHANSIPNPDLIFVDQRLEIPGGSSTRPPIESGTPRVSIAPRSGPPQPLDIYVSGFPANTEILVGIGSLNAEPDYSTRGTTDDGGNFYTDSISVAVDAQPGERYFVSAFLPGSSTRITSREFVVTESAGLPDESGGLELSPDQGPPGTTVGVFVSNFPLNTDVKIDATLPPSESSDFLFQTVGRSDANGVVNTAVTIPATAEVGKTYSIAVQEMAKGGTSANANFTVTADGGTGQTADSALELSASQGARGAMVNVIASGFPPNTDVTINAVPSSGESQGFLFQTVGRSDENGVVDTAVNIPSTAEVGTTYTISVLEMAKDGASAGADFTVVE